MRAMRRNGVLTEGGRWCSFHKWFHGSQHHCNHFSEDTLHEIDLLVAEERKNWSDHSFIQKQLDGGIPVEGVMIMQMFAG